MAHNLLRFILTQECGIDHAKPITLAKNRYGKPYFPDAPGVCFNLSHCRELVLCGIGSSPVGVDAEAIRSIRPAVIRRVCHETEANALNLLPDGMEKDLSFTRIWTLKEAFIKAVGKGLSYPMKTIAFDLASVPDGILTNVTGAVFHQYVIANRYVISACTSDVNDTCELKICSFKQLLF